MVPPQRPAAALEGEAMARRRYRILALDVDGTLLDSAGTLRPRTAEAIARAAQAGICPVLCTGRRYRRALPIAQRLGLHVPIVCNSGAIVKDPVDHRTLWRADLEPELAGAVLDLFAAHEQPPVSFTDLSSGEPDFIVQQFPSGRVYFDDYVGQNHEYARIDAQVLRGRRQGTLQVAHHPHFHLCAIGSRSEMLAFQDVVLGRFGGRLQTFVQRSPRYLGTMCEVLRHDAGKWTAVLHLADLWSIDPAEICAVGDDVNDLPMIRNAGLGVAMGHAPADVLSAAGLVTGDHEHDGVAMLVEDVLLAG
jgi:Cof subfamily protein (haloacid dehalogenase superfamily)